MESIFGVSVVICCYNSSKRLPETLRHLADQAVPEHIPWEVIIVDNASPDDSADVARQQWSTYELETPLRVVAQAIPGLSAARDKGFEEAAFEFVLYCDDDNWLAPDYVRLVYERMVEHPRVGVVGGQGRAEGETELPVWFDQYSRYFAVGPQGGASGDITFEKGYLYGAGLAIRRSAHSRVKHLGIKGRLTGPAGRVRASSDDVELSYLIRLVGYRLWFDTRLEFAHFLPAGRLRWRYFLTLVETTHRSRPYLDAYLLAFREAAEGVTSRRWVEECWRIAWRLLRRPMMLVKAMVGREGSDASFQWHRWRGELAGWLTVRSGHDVLFRELVALREHLGHQDPREP